MSLEENKRLARTFLEATLVGDLATMDAMMAEDATWWVLPTPIAPSLMSKQEFLSFFPSFFANFDGPFTMRFDEITAEDDRVSLTAKGNVKLKSGKTYESDYHFLLTFKAGKIVRMKEYGNTAHAIEVLTG